MRAESADAERRAATISQHWAPASNRAADPNAAAAGGPMALNDALAAQRRRIAELMRHKDALIERLLAAVAAADRRYADDQLQLADDLGALVARIDRHVEVMRTAYAQHLELLRRTVDTERSQFRRAEAQRWHALAAQHDAAELGALEAERQQYERDQRELAAAELQHREAVRETRRRLESGADELQLQLERARVEVLLNGERLRYNHRVLVQRTDENAAVKAAQKRRLGRLHEHVGELRGRLAVQQQRDGADAQRLTGEVTRLYAGVLELDAKAEAFGAQRALRFEGVWRVHAGECAELVRRFGRIDWCVRAEHLLLPVRREELGEWEERVRRLLFVGGIAQTTPKRSSSAGSARGSWTANVRPSSSASVASSASHRQRQLDANVAEQILQRIATQTVWLQDADVAGGCGDFEQAADVAAERLLGIDHVLTALGLASAEHVRAICEHFAETLRCEACGVRWPERTTKETKEESPSSCGRHRFVVEEALVIPTLRSYVERFYRQHFDGDDDDGEESNSGDDVRRRRPRTAVTVRRQQGANDDYNDAERMAAFWRSFVEAVPAHRDRLWTALERQMGRYLQVLKRRERLDGECEFLRRQNAELEHLLGRYVPAAPAEQ